MPLASLDFLAAVVAPVFAADLGGLHRLTIDARRAGGGLPSRRPAHLLPHGRQHFAPSPVIAPLGEVVIDRALGAASQAAASPIGTHCGSDTEAC